MAETPATRNSADVRIAVIGGGVIGLACALALKQGGAEICVYDKALAPAGGASGRAAGMLGSSFEAAGSPEMRALLQRSGQTWRSYAHDIERLGGGDIGYSELPAIFCAMTRDEIESQLNHVAHDKPGLGSVLFLDADEIRRLEPAITGPVLKGAVLLEDRQVDPGLLVERLAAAVRGAEGEVRWGEAVARLECGAVFRTPDGQVWDKVLVASGAGKPPVLVRDREELEARLPPIVPIKGQMLALKPWEGAPRHVIRLSEVYIVPKKRWVLVGATEESDRRDETVEPEVLAKLRAAAAEVVEGVGKAEQAAAWAGIRPGTKDGMPMIGETGIPGVFAAMGHYRNGILLAPETAKMIASQMLEGKVDPEDAAFSPLRFDNRAAPSHSPSVKA